MLQNSINQNQDPVQLLHGGWCSYCTGGHTDPVQLLHYLSRVFKYYVFKHITITERRSINCKTQSLFAIAVKSIQTLFKRTAANHAGYGVESFAPDEPCFKKPRCHGRGCR